MLNALLPEVVEGMWTHAWFYHFVHFELKPYRQDLILDHVWVSPDLRGEGWATRLLNLLTHLADVHRVSIRLRPVPFGTLRRRLRAEKLRDWYRKHGFEPVEGGWMIREPKAKER